jgi:ABC-type nitrate/sulfonate/bicarbonate transport system ATPase subunit
VEGEGLVDAVALDMIGVSRSFSRGSDEQRVLDRVDLRVYESEFVALMGVSGCGKSTLLNIAAGFLSPTTGSVTCAGRPVAGPGPTVGSLRSAPRCFRG